MWRWLAIALLLVGLAASAGTALKGSKGNHGVGGGGGNGGGNGGGGGTTDETCNLAQSGGALLPCILQ